MELEDFCTCYWSFGFIENWTIRGEKTISREKYQKEKEKGLFFHKTVIQGFAPDAPPIEERSAD